MILVVYAARVSLVPSLMDSKSTHFFLACPVFISTSSVDCMHCRMDKPLVVDSSASSPVSIVSCSFVSALARRVYRLVLAEVPDAGQTGISDDLSGVSSTEKYSEPPSSPITWRSQLSHPFSRRVGW